MKQIIYTIAMAQPFESAYDSAAHKSVWMTFLWLSLALVLHFMANEGALRA